MVGEPSVTVLVTVKNSVDTIDKCVESLLSLDYKNYKVYVTDAYSTDGTWEKLEKYKDKIKLERIQKNLPASHNYMIERVDTEFVAFTDADCVVEKKWLTYLLSAFDEDDVIASGGMIRTPEESNLLQKMIGRDLERRFENFPKHVLRLPTISLCVRTDFAKKIKFDESLEVAQETDWGYKLTKFGKMVFVPEALTWHYHRATWKNFFKQQMKYAQYAPKVYFRHRGKSGGDHITTPLMMVQPFLFYFGILFLLSSFLLTELLYLGIASYALLFLIYLNDSLKLSKTIKEFFYYILLFAIRTVAWCLGLATSIFKLF